MESRRRQVDEQQTERRGKQERRNPLDFTLPSTPSWQEQQIQFFTRYLFLGLGLVFFNFAEGIHPAWMSLTQMNLAFGLYFLLHSATVFHAFRQHHCLARYHWAMWLDVAIVSVSVLNDPYSLPPSMLVFIMVVLGNGMRYGMRLFAEALAACLGALMLVFTVRYINNHQDISPGLLYLNLFGGIILVYSYILMARIEKSRKQLEQRSRLDTLTGLMNRRALYEFAEYLFPYTERHGGTLVVMLADLDRFKHINDSYGHAKGDEVLQRFAGILKGSIRGSDIAARLGGDEFVLMLPDTGLDHAEQVARRIQAQVKQYAVDAKLDFGTTIALGEAPAHGRSLDETLHNVDAALYQSKGNFDCSGIQRVQLAPEQASFLLDEPQVAGHPAP